MKFRRIGYAALIAGVVTAPLAAQARDGDDSAQTGPYIGGGYGVTFVDKFCDSSKNNPIDCKRTDSNWRGIIGARFTRFFGIQGSYVRLANFDRNFGTLTGDTRVEGPSASLVGYLPFNRDVSLFAKGGLFFWNVKADVDEGGATLTHDDENDHSPVAGLGLQAGLTEHVKLQLEYDRYFDVGHKNSTGQSDVDTVGVNAIYQF